MKKPFLLSLLSGAIFALSWPATGNISYLLLLGFVPLFIIEEEYSNPISAKSWRSLFGYAYLAFAIWNFCTTGWIYCVTESIVTKLFISGGAIFANALLMSAPFMAFHFTKKRLGRKEGYIGLFVYWLAFEYFHHNWDMSWTWLTLGHGLANYPPLIQWYEFTGPMGGSAWILLSNIMIYEFYRTVVLPRKKTVNHPVLFSFLLAVIFVPIGCSLLRYFTYKEKNDPVEITVVQPNIDPYKKFNEISPAEQLDKLFKLAVVHLTPVASYLVAPETALTENIWENDLSRSASVRTIKEFMKKYPELKFVTGASTYRAFEPGEPKPAAARIFSDGGGWYEAYNTALQFDSTKTIQVHHKSKLVVGVEKLPFTGIFKFIEGFALDLGGTSGSLGTETSRNPFFSPDSALSVVPPICFESVFGEHIGEYLRQGGNLIFVITNDGWWGDTPGHRQHFAYSRMLAIGHRRSIARAANTGISGFINQRGDVIYKTGWWKDASFNGTLNANSEKTFYTMAGDYIGRVSSFISVMLLLLTMVRGYLRNKKSADVNSN